MRKRYKIPPLGSFLIVYWHDACTYKEIEPEKCQLIEAMTLGVLIRIDKEFVALAQSRFINDNGAIDYREVTCIPRSQITMIRKGKSG